MGYKSLSCSKKNFSFLGGVMLLLLACTSNIGSTNQKQNMLTISDSPVFPYTKSSSNKYILILSNHGNSELKLDYAQLDEVVSTDSIAPDEKKLEELVNTKACNKIIANSNCMLEIMLPKDISNGFYTFTLNYTNNKNQHYPVTKFIAFNNNIVSNNGITVTNKNIEIITENLNKFTLALPFYLSQDFKDIQIQDLGKPVQKYTDIQCSSLIEDKTQSNNATTDKIAQYSANSSCTLIVELDTSTTNHELTLTGVTTDGQDITSVINTRTILGDYAHLIYTGAPALVKKGETKSVYIHNIGTTAARGVVLQQKLKAGSTASPLDGSSQITCSSNIIQPGASCQLKYVALNDKASILEQTISYANRVFAVEPDSYFVYINSMPLASAPTVTSIDPASNKSFNYHERPESIVVEFSAPINSSTINAVNFNLQKDGLDLNNNIFEHFSPNYIRLIPEESFAPGTYQLTLSGLSNQQGTITSTTSSFKIRNPLMIEESSTIGNIPINLGGTTNIQNNTIPQMEIKFSEELADGVEIIILQGAACSRLPRESTGNCPIVSRQTNTGRNKTIVVPQKNLAVPSEYGVFVRNAKGINGELLDVENSLWLQPITHFAIPFVIDFPTYLDYLFQHFTQIVTGSGTGRDNCSPPNSIQTCIGLFRGFITVSNSGAYNIYLPHKRISADNNAGYARIQMLDTSNRPPKIGDFYYEQRGTLGFPVMDYSHVDLFSAVNLVTPLGNNHPIFFYTSGKYNKGEANKDYPKKICEGRIDDLLGLTANELQNIHTIFTAPLNKDIQDAKWVIFNNKNTLITNSDFTKILWKGKVSDIWPDLDRYANKIGSAIPYVFNGESMLALILRDGSTEYLNVKNIKNVPLLSTGNDLPGSCSAS